MSSTLLSRHSRPEAARPALRFLADLSLPLARTHEICGNARRFLACVIATRLSGPVFWIAPSWQVDRLNPEAVGRLFDPSRITFIEPERAEDLLWCMEEVLRAGVVPLVVADLPAPPGLTSVRRLHLAAETGAAEGSVKPLALLLTPGDGGAPGVESRWHMASAHKPDGSRGWHLERRRARTAPQKSWRMEPMGGQFQLEALTAE